LPSGTVALQVAMRGECWDFGKATEGPGWRNERRLYLGGEIRAEFGAIVGESPALNTACTWFRSRAYEFERADLGETGTGKELIARAIQTLVGDGNGLALN